MSTSSKQILFLSLTIGLCYANQNPDELGKAINETLSSDLSPQIISCDKKENRQLQKPKLCDQNNYPRPKKNHPEDSDYQRRVTKHLEILDNKDFTGKNFEFNDETLSKEGLSQTDKLTLIGLMKPTIKRTAENRKSLNYNYKADNWPNYRNKKASDRSRSYIEHGYTTKTIPQMIKDFKKDNNESSSIDHTNLVKSMDQFRSQKCIDDVRYTGDVNLFPTEYIFTSIPKQMENKIQYTYTDKQIDKYHTDIQKYGKEYIQSIESKLQKNKDFAFYCSENIYKEETTTIQSSHTPVCKAPLGNLFDDNVVAISLDAIKKAAKDSKQQDFLECLNKYAPKIVNNKIDKDGEYQKINDEISRLYKYKIKNIKIKTASSAARNNVFKNDKGQYLDVNGSILKNQPKTTEELKALKSNYALEHHALTKLRANSLKKAIVSHLGDLHFNNDFSVDLDTTGDNIPGHPGVSGPCPYRNGLFLNEYNKNSPTADPSKISELNNSKTAQVKVIFEEANNFSRKKNNYRFAVKCLSLRMKCLPIAAKNFVSNTKSEKYIVEKEQDITKELESIAEDLF